MRTTQKRLLAALLALSAVSALAFNGDVVTSKGVAKLKIAPMQIVTDPSAHTPVTITLENLSQTVASGTLEIDRLTDDWKVIGPAQTVFNLQPAESKSFDFKITSGPRVYSIHYPVHVKATFNNGIVLNAVQIFEVKALSKKAGENMATPQPLPVIVIQPNSICALIRHTKYARVAWNYYDKPLWYKPVGWLGADDDSRAYWSFGNIGAPDIRPAFTTHPTWYPDGGSVFCDFKVQLPSVTPIKLSFSTAQRKSHKNEPNSDGITYRILAVLDDVTFQKVFEIHHDSKTWTPSEADLSAFAGKTITLRFESNPGPARDTQVDSGYWANPTITAGVVKVPESPFTLTEDDLKQAKKAADKARKSAPCTIVIPGEYGILDAIVAFVNKDGQFAAFKGFKLNIENNDLLTNASSAKITCGDVAEKDNQRVYSYKLQANDLDATLTVTHTTLPDGFATFNFKANNARIAALNIGNWHDKTERFFFGHGYVLIDPKPFRLSFGGHDVAASHVGYEFKDAPAVLKAIDNPPSVLQVTPETHTYTLGTSNDATLTFTTDETAFKAAFKYQDKMDKKPAGAVKNLAGRLVLDIWGGSFQRILEGMKELTRYDATDLMLTIHNWQRWGYDYRLPDIWPPNPRIGTVDTLKLIQKHCASYDIPWGLHDNYIDFYPDADDYSAENLYFHTQNGQPVRAWYNKGRKAQSYKFRPDKIMDFVQRNFKLITKEVKPTACFIDVFTSANVTAYYDWNGNYHTNLETRKHWGEAFAWIRDFLGGNAPTTSEAGHDQLIGYLDGADCQWLSLTDKRGEKFMRYAPCASWERTPWADAVNHERFVWIGAGYSSRFIGDGSIAAHGIASDDYLSTEIMAGHSLMVESSCWGYDTLRKYWLAQDFIRSIATKKMTAHEFVDNSIHKQFIQWETGAKVWVNRSSDEDWTVNGKTLPPYGFYIEYPKGSLGVIRENGQIKEFSLTEDALYANSRSNTRSKIANSLDVKATVSNASFKDGNFNYTITWNVNEDCQNAFSTFIHFVDKSTIIFQDDHMSSVPTQEWKKGMTVVTNRSMTIPNFAKKQTYTMIGGLFSSKGLSRVETRGKQFGGTTVELGTLTLERNDDGKLVNVTFTPPEPIPEIKEKLNVNKLGETVDFGFAKTNGMFKLSKSGSAWHLTPAPYQHPFAVTLAIDKLFPGSPELVVRAEPLEPNQKPENTYTQNGNELKIEIDTKQTFKLIITQK